MPLAENVVRVIPPAGESVVVDILDTTGTSVAAYTGRTGSDMRAMPLTVTTQTDFYIKDQGAYDVSVKLNGVEIAAAGGAVHRVNLVGGPPELVAPTVDEAERVTLAGGSGGSIPTGQDGTATDVTLSYGAVRSFVTDSGAVVIAVGLAGEDFPRALVTSDGQMFFGDGTADPSAGTVYLYGDGSSLNIGADLWFLSGSSPVMASANNSHHRVKVANNGAISTEGLSGAPSWSPVDIAAPAIGNAGQAVVVNGSGNGFEYGAPAAAATPYDGSTSGIGWDVQSALDNLAARVTALETP